MIVGARAAVPAGAAAPVVVAHALLQRRARPPRLPLLRRAGMSGRVAAIGVDHPFPGRLIVGGAYRYTGRGRRIVLPGGPACDARSPGDRFPPRLGVIARAAFRAVPLFAPAA